MTIFRFSVLVLALAGCTIKEDNVGPLPKPSLFVRSGGDTYTIGELLKLQRENPNNFVLRLREIEVESEPTSIPLFDEDAQKYGYPYVLPLKAGHINYDTVIEGDFKSLSPLELEMKYGEEAAGQMIHARVRSANSGQDDDSILMSDAVEFRASMQLTDFDMQKAARLKVGQPFDAKCETIELSPVAISFVNCTVD